MFVSRLYIITDHRLFGALEGNNKELSWKEVFPPLPESNVLFAISQSALLLAMIHDRNQVEKFVGPKTYLNSFIIRLIPKILKVATAQVENHQL